jgi:hypothetical protein
MSNDIIEETIELELENVAESVANATIETPPASANATPKVKMEGFRPDDFSRSTAARFLKKGDDWMSDKSRLTWSEIEAAYDVMTEEEKTELTESWEKLVKQRTARKRRYERLLEALNRHGMKMRGDSDLCKKFVFFAQGDLRDIVIKMFKTSLCFKYGANEEFKEKMKNNTEMTPERYVAERDHFFEAFYAKKVAEDPELTFKWVPHPSLVAQQQQTQVHHQTPHFTYPRGQPRGRGGYYPRGRGGYYNNYHQHQYQHQHQHQHQNQFDQVQVQQPQEGGFYQPRGRGGFQPRGRGGFQPRGRGGFQPRGRGGYYPQ